MIDCALLKNAFLFRFKSRQWGNVRKMELTDAAVEAQIGPRPPGMFTDEEWQKKIAEARKVLKGSKQLIQSKLYGDITEYQSSLRKEMLARYCNPSFIDEGWYVVKREAAEAVKAEVNRASGVLADLVKRFIEQDYAPAIERMAGTIGAQFAAKDYPSATRMSELFGLEYRLVQFDVPDGLDPATRAEEEAKLRASYTRAEKAITGALWASFKDFVEEIEMKLSVNGDGKPRVFRNTLFNDLTTFVQSFANRNTFNDSALADLVQKAEAIVSKVGGENNEEKAQRMRDFEGLREQTKIAFDGLKAEVAQAIAERPERLFNFEEE